MTKKLIAHLKEYFLMAKTIKLLSKEQYKEYKSRVNAYERDWRNKHKALHKENSEKLLSAIKQPKKKTAKIATKKIVTKPKTKVDKKIAPKKSISKKLDKMIKENQYVEIPKATDAENEELWSVTEKSKEKMST